MTIQTREITSPAYQLNDLIGELKSMIDQARKSIASTVNIRLAMLYWHIGNRVRKEILKDERAEYGRTIVASVARQLTLQYGKGFSEKSLRRMIQFGEVFPDQQIVASLLRQLSWTHFTLLLPIKDSIKRDFYSEMCRIEKWNVRTLEKKIDSMLYERTALSKKPEALAQIELNALRKEDQLTPDLVFRDPYVLEFLNLNDHYIEKDLEGKCSPPLHLGQKKMRGRLIRRAKDQVWKGARFRRSDSLLSVGWCGGWPRLVFLPSAPQS